VVNPEAKTRAVPIWLAAVITAFVIGVLLLLLL
jgi:hypothetical protein